MTFPSYPKYRDSGVEWLDYVPDHWCSVPIKYMALERSSLFLDGDWIESKDISSDGIRYITTGNVGEGAYKEQGAGFISQDTFHFLRCTEVYEGDVLVSRLNNPIGRACVVPDLGGKVVTSVDNVIFRPDSKFYRKFIVYLFSSEEYFKHTSNLARGATMQRISRGLLGNIRVVTPSLEEQIQIARFLDHETAKIDALIREQERLIELLQEKRQAVISHAVTKGLDPDVPMKDSGVEWLGEVPAHWDVVRVATLYAEVAEQGAPHLPVLRVSIHHGVSDRELTEAESDRKITRIEDRQKYKTVRPGDLVYNMMRAWQGGFGAVLVDGLVSPAYVVARPQDKALSRYVEMLLRTPRAVEEMRSRSYGITDFRLRLYWDQFKTMKIIAPPFEERELIMEKIDQLMKESGDLENEAIQLIGYLQERRSALISAAVTGKIDVRDWQPPVDESAYDEEVRQAGLEVPA